MGSRQLGVWTTSSLTSTKTISSKLPADSSPGERGILSVRSLHISQAEQMTVLEVVQLRPAYIESLSRHKWSEPLTQRLINWGYIVRGLGNKGIRGV